jgi:hypothetical protein
LFQRYTVYTEKGKERKEKGKERKGKKKEGNKEKKRPGIEDDSKIYMVL